MGYVMDKMTLEQALKIAGEFSVKKKNGEVILKVGGITSRHKNAREAYSTLEEIARRTEQISTEENPPEWYQILFNSGFSPIRAIRVYDLSQALVLRQVVASYMDYINWFARECHG